MEGFHNSEGGAPDWLRWDMGNAHTKKKKIDVRSRREMSLKTKPKRRLHRDGLGTC